MSDDKYSPRGFKLAIGFIRVMPIRLRPIRPIRFRPIRPFFSIEAKQKSHRDVGQLGQGTEKTNENNRKQHNERKNKTNKTKTTKTDLGWDIQYSPCFASNIFTQTRFMPV